MNKIVLITGATAGIGKACAEKFAANGYNLIISGRRKDRLEEIAKSLTSQYKIEVLPLVFDIQKRKEVETAILSLDKKWQSIDILINNAGLAAGLSKFQDGEIDDWEQMIDTNIKGLYYVSRMVAPMMIEAGKGHIINIGSIAGREVYPNGNIYCASKFAVDALTKGMRIDMLGTGVKVSQIAPGAVETEFSIVRFKGDSERAAKVYEGYKPLAGEDIADVAFYMALLPQHVNIADVVVMPTNQAGPTLVHRS